ncbi:cytochrome P450 6B4-like [Bicyclus anynana]|uniref:unspecific monooxygenase n=1 Tax=Bicyclus anynana TaxID=110368 RepID=A0ABM3LNV6_BICAN|nr:cytochrome P450 6B4-like [Bicyclus anynana]
MTTPSLLIRDLDLVKTICVKDFDNFDDRGIELSGKGLELSNFFVNLVRDSMQARNGIPSNRKDFIDLILEMRNQGTSVTIEKGTIVLIPTLAISHDEKYFPDPSKFDPERFSPENESKRHPCAFIPFGTGPRFCIGMLLAKIQSRVCLMKLLYHFRVEVSKNTPKVLSFDPQRVVIAPRGGIYLNLIPRK